MGHLCSSTQKTVNCPFSSFLNRKLGSSLFAPFHTIPGVNSIHSCHENNLDTNEIVLSVDGGSIITLVFSDSSSVLSSTRKDYGNTHLMLFHYFSAAYSFSYTVDSSTNAGNLAISLTNDNFTKDIGINSALTSLEANKPNVIGEVRYFSINEVHSPDSMSGLTRETDGTVSNSECASKMFVWLGELKNCVPSCPTDRTIQIRFYANMTACSASSEPTYFTVYGLTDVYLRQTCSAEEGYFYQTDNTSTICLEGCSNPFSYQNGDSCVSNCPDYYKTEDLAQIGTVNEKGNCADDCPNEFYFNSPQNNRWYCVSTCPPSKSGFELEASTGRKICISPSDCLPPKVWDGVSCSDNCPTNKPYLRQNGIITCVSHCDDTEWLELDSTESFHSSEVESYENKSKCLDECSNFKLISNFSYLSSNKPKNYCLAVCPIDLVTTPDSCLNTCEEHPTHKLTTPTGKCTTNCQSEGYMFTVFDSTCANECSYLRNGTNCVKECPQDKLFIYNHECTEKCPNKVEMNTNICLDTCPEYELDNVCVFECSSKENEIYFLSHGWIHENKPFIGESGKCVDKCTSVAIEETMECVSACPPCSSDCDWSEFKFQDDKGFCRETCENTSNPLREGAKCVSTCSEATPYLNDGHCLVQCPQGKKYVLETERGKECLLTCPYTHRFQLNSTELVKCLSSCPPLTRNEGNICLLDCSSQPGSIEEGDKCVHCQRERAQFEFNNTCVKDCPTGTVSDGYYSCKTCLDLGLWRDDQQRCIPESNCPSKGLKDYENKICSTCLSEGKMLMKREPAEFSCTETDCEGGITELISNVKYCTYCQKGHFYWNLQCNPYCEEPLQYDFLTFQCKTKCFGCECCVNGDCRSGCVCQNGWTGEHCNIPEKEGKRVVLDIIQFLEDNLSSELSPNKIALYTQVNALSSHTSTEILSNLVESTLKHILKQDFTPLPLYSLSLLDVLLPLSIKTATTAKTTDILYKTINQINEFNMSVENNASKAENASFNGKHISFSFGSNTANQANFNVDKCKTNITNHFNLDVNAQIPWALLYFSPEVSPHISYRPTKTLEISSNPVQELYLFHDSSQLDASYFCQERLIDTRFNSQLSDPNQIEAIRTLKNTEISPFNRNEQLFNDKCLPFSSESKDFTLSTRRETLFIDPAKACNESLFQVCSVEYFNIQGQIRCYCKGIREKKKSKLETFFSTYPSTNYSLAFCWGTFTKAKLKSNIGFRLTVIPFILTLIAWLFSRWKTARELKSAEKFKYLRTDFNFLLQSEMDTPTYFLECASLKKTMKRLKFTRVAKSVCREMLAVLPSLKDYDSLSTEELIKYDTRPILVFIADVLRLEHSFIQTFFTNTLIEPKIFTFFLFLTELNLEIMLNAFFIDDSMVEDSQNGETTFVEGIMTVLWANFTAKAFKILIKSAYNLNVREQSRFLRRMNYFDSVYLAASYENFISKHITRMTVFFTVIAVFNVFCCYFVVIFTEVYQNSIDLWTNGIVFGLIMDNLVLQLVLPLLLVLTRMAAKKNDLFVPLFDWIRRLSHLKRLDLF